MAITVIQATLNPKYQKECFFPQIDKKVELCTKMKKLRVEIISKLDKEHRNMLQQYDELWNKPLGDMCFDSAIGGLKLKH